MNFGGDSSTIAMNEQMKELMIVIIYLLVSLSSLLQEIHPVNCNQISLKAESCCFPVLFELPWSGNLAYIGSELG
jgi:hypothetical protein